MNSTLTAKDLPITIDPEIVSGAPVFRGTRVPIQTLFDYLADGYSLEEILAFFPNIKREDAVRLIEAAPQLITDAVPA
jgi:uncharacterized protein (DUF433 family)